MLVGYDFPGDDNDTLKWVQHDCYWGNVGRLFEAAKNRYIRACHFIGVETEVFERLLAITGFDHRDLQASHDKIAAYYRFAHDDGGQMTLFSLAQPIETYFPDSEEACYKAQLLAGWSEFYNEEVEKLAEDNAIAHAILNAVVHEYKPKGYEAEKLLVELLDARYGEFKFEGSVNDMWCSASKLEDND